MWRGRLARALPKTQSHSFVVWASTAFGWDPIDDLVGVGDVARLAVDAIRRVDFEFRRAFFRTHLVDCRRTEILARVAVLADAAVAANIRVENNKMARLVLLVARSRMIYVSESIEGQLAVALESRGLIDGRSVEIELCVFLVSWSAAHRVEEA